jgi:hypothetical protein
MAKRPEAPKFTSFKGVFVFPKLSSPDYGNKDYPKPDGVFSTKLRGKADDPEVMAMLAQLEPFHAAALQQADTEFKALKPDTRKKLGKVSVQPLFSTIFDEDENETGEIDFNFTMPYSGVFKKGPKEGQTWKRVPDIFDARGNKLSYFDKQKNPIKGMPDIWGGTVGRIAFELGMNKEGQPGYFIPGTGLAGLSLKLRAVRLIKLVSGGSRSASDYGFEGEEEGDDLSNLAPATSSDSDSSDKTEQTSSAETAADDNTDF